jgi:hypothetical protein
MTRVIETETEIETDVMIAEVTEPEDIDIPDVTFVSTGSETRDRAIKGIFMDGPRLIKAANKAGKWDDILKSINPAGTAEIFAVRNSVDVLNEKGTIIDLKDDQVIPLLKKVKMNLLSGHQTVIQAYNKNTLIDHIKRIDLSKLAAMPVAKAAEIVEDVEAVKIDLGLVGNVLTNVNGDTYTFGNRGRRPQWVIDWVAKNADLVPKK